jgi:hypothetical protein
VGLLSKLSCIDLNDRAAGEAGDPVARCPSFDRSSSACRDSSGVVSSGSLRECGRWEFNDLLDLLEEARLPLEDRGGDVGRWSAVGDMVARPILLSTESGRSN